MSVKSVCRDVELFLRGLARELPGVFPRPARRPAALSPRRTAGQRPSPEKLAPARELINARAAYWAAALGVRYNRVSVKAQRTLWGSCSRRGNLNFNWRLAEAPPETLDYVVIHELCHLREMNHSKRFWAHVEAACPDYMARRRWLRLNGTALMNVSGGGAANG